MHIEVVPAAAACNLEARRLAGLAKAGRQEPVVRLLDRGVSGAAAREGLTAKPARPEMAPQRLEKIGSAPGIGIALAALDHKIWCWEHMNLVPNIRAASRRMAAAPKDMRGAHLLAAPQRVARKWRCKSLK